MDLDSLNITMNPLDVKDLIWKVVDFIKLDLNECVFLVSNLEKNLSI
jgi:hypothetical protein